MTHTLAELDQIVGGMTEQMNDKMDTDGRNGTNTVDYVIEWQLPTAENNYSWYRKYKSGWVEQGGLLGTNVSSQTISLLITMSDTYYSIQLSIGNFSGTGTTGYGTTHGWGQRTVNAFHVDSYNTTNVTGQWEVKGFAAQT